MITLHSPLFLLLLLLLPAAYRIFRKAEPAAILFSNVQWLPPAPAISRFLMWIPAILGWTGLGLLIIAMARPQKLLSKRIIKSEAIDMVLAIDLSSSMLIEDFQDNEGQRSNRLEAVRHVLADFITKRKGDRLGMIAFAGRPYIVAPLTFDHEWLAKALDRLRVGLVEDGTAIGSALGTAVSRLKDSEAKTKIVILLTDGANNRGRLTPLQAAETAKAFGVRVYTIGAGTEGIVPMPIVDDHGNYVYIRGQKRYQSVQSEVDMETLAKIAKATDGAFFHAENLSGLKEVYAEIDRLEKTLIENKIIRNHKELYPAFAWAGIICLFLQITLQTTVLRRYPGL